MDHNEARDFRQQIMFNNEGSFLFIHDGHLLII